MPRNGRGGSRSGRPGAAYPNRRDLNTKPREAGKQAVRARPSREYGGRAAEEERMKAMPLPRAGAPIGALVAPAGQGPEPGSLPGLTSPSQNPGQPITAGLPMGPGAGPSALAAPPPEPGGAGLLRRLIAEDPDPELFALLEAAERSAGAIPLTGVPRNRGMVPPPFTPGRLTGTRAGMLGRPTGVTAGNAMNAPGMQPDTGAAPPPKPGLGEMEL